MRKSLTRIVSFNIFFSLALGSLAQGGHDVVAMITPSNGEVSTSAELLRFKEMLTKYQPLVSDDATMPEVGNPDISALFEVRIDIPELGKVQVTAFLFAPYSHEVDPMYREWLDHYARTLKRYPLAHVHVEAHTDDVGTDSSNLALSELRALEVKEQLVQRGIPEVRITATGMGEKAPLVSNLDTEGRSRNRRVELHNYFPVERQ